MADSYKEDATQPQIDLLKKLGYQDKPKNKAQASSLIDILLKKQHCEGLVKLIDSGDSIEQSIGLYAKIVVKCIQNKIYDPPVIGMIYNKECDKRNK